MGLNLQVQMVKKPISFYVTSFYFFFNVLTNNTLDANHLTFSSLINQLLISRNSNITKSDACLSKGFFHYIARINLSHFICFLTDSFTSTFTYQYI